MQKTRKQWYRSKWVVVLVVGMSLTFVLAGGKPVHALSDDGPDSTNDFITDTAGGGFGYVVTSPTDINVVIPTTHVEIYFKTATPGTNKTVTIRDADLCTDNRATGNNNRDLWVDGTGASRPTNGKRTTEFYVQSGAYQSATTYGDFSNAGNCRTATKTLTFPSDKLQYVADIGYYEADFVAQGVSVWPIEDQNVFDIEISGSGSIVGYDSGESSTSFGVSRRYPSSGFADYNLRFGTPCADTTDVTASGDTYDDDNGSATVQDGKYMTEDLRSYNANGTYEGLVPLKFSGYTHYTKLAGENEYQVGSGNEKTVTMTFTAKPGYTYDWHWSVVYYVNILQFRLPFDSIYDVAKCIQPIPAPTCGAVNVAPAIIDPHTAFSVTAAANFATPADASEAKADGDKISVGVTGPGYTYGPDSLTSTVSGNSLNATTGNIGPTGDTGTYNVTARVVTAAGVQLVTCPTSFIVADLPTTRIPTGNVEAGEGMGGTNCTTPADDLAGIVSWNQGTAADEYTAGAGTAYAALVLNHLQGFVSGQGSNLAGSGLSFANNADGDVNPANSLFGGNFGAESCAPDYFASHPTTPTHTGDDTISTVAGGTNVVYVTGGNVTISNALNVPNGSHTTIYVDGNVYIDGNITYSGNYGSVADIPSYSIIAEGNIYIAPTVSELDGLYVAEPDVVGDVSTNGIIYTCTSAPFTAAALTSTLYATCDKDSLTVNGSFVARQVWLLRTTGTVSGTSAETFDFDPETWLTTPPATDDSGATLGDGYDAITSLPPVL